MAIVHENIYWINPLVHAAGNMLADCDCNAGVVSACLAYSSSAQNCRIYNRGRNQIHSRDSYATLQGYGHKVKKLLDNQGVSLYLFITPVFSCLIPLWKYIYI